MRLQRRQDQKSKDLDESQDSTKGPRGPSVDERINKVWSVHTREYYSALKGTEILSHETQGQHAE